MCIGVTLWSTGNPAGASPPVPGRPRKPRMQAGTGNAGSRDRCGRCSAARRPRSGEIAAMHRGHRSAEGRVCGDLGQGAGGPSRSRHRVLQAVRPAPKSKASTDPAAPACWSTAPPRARCLPTFDSFQCAMERNRDQSNAPRPHRCVRRRRGTRMNVKFELALAHLAGTPELVRSTRRQWPEPDAGPLSCVERSVVGNARPSR